MTKKIIIDHAKCTGCYMCGQVCSLVKTGTCNPAASRIRIIDWESTGVTVPVVCQHCAEPVCLPACPVDAISKDGTTGVVSIDPEQCINCASCRQVCPFAGPVYSIPEQQVVLCDYCGGEPACVPVCPTEALLFEDDDRRHAGQRLAAMRDARASVIKKERLL